MANPYGQLVNTSRSNGLGVQQSWMMLFRWNEYQWARDPTLVLSEQEIVDHMKELFPDRDWSKNMQAVGRNRRAYNRGEFTRGQVPSHISYRYDVLGKTVRRRVPTTPEEQWPTKDRRVRRKRPKVGPIELE